MDYPDRTPSTSEQILAALRSYEGSSSLLLDLQERITKCEYHTQHAENQRLEIINSLAEMRTEIRSVNLDMLARDVKELRERVSSNSKTIDEAQGGFNVGIGMVRAVWAFVGMIGGAILMWLTKKFGN